MCEERFDFPTEFVVVAGLSNDKCCAFDRRPFKGRLEQRLRLTPALIRHCGNDRIRTAGWPCLHSASAVTSRDDGIGGTKG